MPLTSVSNKVDGVAGWDKTVTDVNNVDETFANARDLGYARLNNSRISVIGQLGKYDNKDNPPWESHLKFVDVQIIFEGAEDFIIANTSTLKPKTYDEASDYHDWEGEGTVRLTLSQGEILILLPYDAHRVGLPPKTGKTHVKKAIVKVPYKG